MSVLSSVLQDEIDRLESNVLALKQKLLALPKGSVSIIKKYNSYFAYRKYREGNKILTKYIGPLNEAKTQDEINKINDYKRIKTMIASSKQEICKIKRALIEYERK